MLHDATVKVKLRVSLNQLLHVTPVKSTLQQISGGPSLASAVTPLTFCVNVYT